MKIIILAGGKGTRLWPLSRNSFPKQFLHFGDKMSLLQKTIARFTALYDRKDILILTNQSYYHLVKSQCSELDPYFEYTILQEPEGKNTAPAIALAAKYLQEKMGCGDDEVFLVSSSDHLISPQETFLSLLPTAENEAKKGSIITFGVHPNIPETGYGYIKFVKEPGKDCCNVESFVEKPSLDLAKQYILSGNYLWNSGIFAFKMETFWQELSSFCPEVSRVFEGSFEQSIAQFSLSKDISIDYAVMEKSALVKVLPMNLSWSDVGSWDSVYDNLEKDSHSNVKVGNVVDVDTKNSLIFGGKRLISTIGIEDMIIVETNDALLVSKKGHSQKVKTLVERLVANKITQSTDHLTSHRPWGSYTVLEEGARYKIKKITVNPGQRLSLQLHYHRSEHWVVVKGTARVTLGTNEVLLHENESVYVEKSQTHRLENPGRVPLELIEVQVGEYVGEDDIVRVQDDYARV
ncbi:MAG: mannose-1-phosphate guanylyltransferase/mannose-6-phosphate isomerase [Chlamydiae bacterium]|nr:mannose-1-phosphate guanylyltransferase/mannose-6-phosphate isomerase [Chlamydiota bacterium]